MPTQVLIGVDPDTKATGIAVLMNGALYATFVAQAKGRTAFDRVEGMGAELQETFLELRERIFPFPDRMNPEMFEIKIAIEWQGARPGDPRPQSILDLAIVAGMIYQTARRVFPQAKIFRPYPVQWKGSIPKPVHQKRIRREMFGSPNDQSLEATWGQTNASHVLDAAGLALALQKGKIR